MKWKRFTSSSVINSLIKYVSDYIILRRMLSEVSFKIVILLFNNHTILRKISISSKLSKTLPLRRKWRRETFKFWNRWPVWVQVYFAKADRFWSAAVTSVFMFLKTSFETTSSLVNVVSYALQLTQSINTVIIPFLVRREGILDSQNFFEGIYWVIGASSWLDNPRWLGIWKPEVPAWNGKRHSIQRKNTNNIYCYRYLL